MDLFPFLTTGLDHRSVHYVLTILHTLPGNACKRWNLFTPNIIDKTSWCVPSPIPKNMLQEVPTIRDFKISDSRFFVKNSVVPPKFMNSMRFSFKKKERNWSQKRNSLWLKPHFCFRPETDIQKMSWYFMPGTKTNKKFQAIALTLRKNITWLLSTNAT